MLNQELFVNLSGVELFVRKLFPGKKNTGELPAIIFLHEGLGSINQWRDFPEKVVKATGFPAIVYDRQGGKSSPLTKTRQRLGYEPLLMPGIFHLNSLII